MTRTDRRPLTIRTLHRFILVRCCCVAVLALPGCVPATQYEEAKSSAEVEREGHRRSAQALFAAEQEVARLEQERDQLREKVARLESTLETKETELAERALTAETTAKQRDEHAELVGQLRGELARVSEHLRAFSQEKDGLSDRLTKAQDELDRLRAEADKLRLDAQQKTEVSERLDSALHRLEELQKDAGPPVADAAPSEDSTAADDAPAEQEPDSPSEQEPEASVPSP